MAASAWTFYNHMKKNLGLGKIVLSGATLRMSLFLSTSNAATATLSTLASVTNEVAEANGYSSSGKALPSQTWLSGASAGQWRLNHAALVWTGTGGTISGVKYAVIWAIGASAGARKLVCWSQLSSSRFDITINNTLTVTPAATGVFNLA